MLNHILQELKSNHDIFTTLFKNISQTQSEWRSRKGKWSLIEIACHLRDEEQEDFKARLASVLKDPSKPFTPIDPASWVESRNYQLQKFEVVKRAFFEERLASIAWLESLVNPKWDNTYIHPTLGRMTAHLILSNWLAHDYLHIRQILNLKYNYLQFTSKESLSYAGVW